MDKKIPIYFDSVVVSSPFQGISNEMPNIGRLKVRVFTKYGNRNGSYITDAVAQQLISTAITGSTPVVGFFDPSTNTWASHSGPKLAKSYGYVEDFIGWEPFEDTDGVTREYAVFSIVLFTDYFEEAGKIYGQNQSMQLDPESIQGNWTTIQNEEYFVYTKAKMLGFCIIGEHEPCFSVSSFFSKNDEDYKSQYEKFTLLLSDLKAKVKEFEKGGEQPMNEVENQEVVVDTVQEAPIVETPAENENFEAEEEVEVKEAGQPSTEEDSTPSEFEVLQQQYNELQTSYDELKNNFSALQEQLNQISNAKENAEQEVETLRNKVAELQNSVQSYEAAAAVVENERKDKLIDEYKNILEEEEIAPIMGEKDNFSYEELENKLAVIFAHKQINNKKSEVNKVPVSEPEESQFSLLMKKYRKN